MAGSDTCITPLNEGRSLNPGDTGIQHRHVASTDASLNEGRSLNPGDTAIGDAHVSPIGPRSTKAGV